MKSLQKYIAENRDREFVIYIMCGMPGSGKSTWVKETLGDIPVVSRDITRSKLGYTRDESHKAILTAEQEREITRVNNKLMRGYIRAHCSFVIDDTNTGKFRDELIQQLRTSGAVLIGVNVVTPPRTCIRRWARQIPPEDMRHLYGTLRFI